MFPARAEDVHQAGADAHAQGAHGQRTCARSRPIAGPVGTALCPSAGTVRFGNVLDDASDVLFILIQRQVGLSDDPA